MYTGKKQNIESAPEQSKDVLTIKFQLIHLKTLILYIKFKKAMVIPSIVFYVFFAIPYIFVMYWLVKQDKKKHAWGVTVVTAIAIVGFVVSQRASRIAIQNYKQHQEDARLLEKEADSILNRIEKKN